MFALVDILLLALLLFPIAVYCTILGMINRRVQPLMVSGSWDFAGVLLATSGFLLFAGPVFVSGAFRQNLRELPIEHDTDALGSAIAETLAAWWVVWLLYYLCVVGGGAFLVWMRRGTTVIYNIDPETLDTVCARAAQRLGLSLTRRGNRLHFSPSAADGAPAAPDGGALPAPSPVPLFPSSIAAVVIDLESFPLLSNAAVHWRSGAPEVRADLERELRKSLAEVFTLENPGGTWLLGIAAFLFLLIMLLTAVFILITMRGPRP